jgi:hypothetical protein
VQAIALTITLLFESAGMGVFSAISGARGRRILRDAAVAAGTNLVIHTLFWYTFPLLGPSSPAKLWVYESIIVIIEAKVYQVFCRMAGWKAFVLSLLLNLGSFLLGQIIWERIW